MEKVTKLNIGGRIAILGAAIIWGSSFFVLKNAIDELPVFFVLAFRFSAACLLLLIIFITRILKIKKKDIKSYIVYGLICGSFLTLGYTAQTLGLAESTPSKNAFLTTIYVIVVPFVFWLVNKTRPDKYNYMAAFFCLIGIGFVILNESLTINLWEALTLFGGIGFAFHIVSLTMATRDRDPIVVTIFQFGTASVYFWILNYFFGEMPDISEVSKQAGIEIIYLAVFGTATALLLQTVGQKYTPPSQAAILVSFESVFGVLFSVIFYHEQLSLKLLVGFLIMFIAVIVSETKLSFIKKNIKKKKKYLDSVTDN